MGRNTSTRFDQGIQERWRSLLENELRKAEGTDLFGYFSVEKFATAQKAGEYIATLVGGLCLDIGCGILPWPIYMTGNIQWIGIDPYLGSKREFLFAQAMGETLPFPDGIFDGVTIMSVLDHVLDCHLVLQEAKRVLKLSGKLFIWYLMMEGPNEHHMRGFNQASLTKAIEECGFYFNHQIAFHGDPVVGYPDTHLMVADKKDSLNLESVTVIIVNRKTLDLTRRTLETLLRFYPSLNVLLIDNKSGNDPSREYVQNISSTYPNVRPYMITSGVPHHATGLNAGAARVKTPYFLTMDSDVMVLRGGWIEKMLAAFEADPLLFVIGSLALDANSDCTRPPGPGERAYHFVSPYCAMWDRLKYESLGIPFVETGQPACAVCTEAERMGYRLGGLEGLHPNNKSTAPMYTYHEWGGTRTRLAVLEDEERRRRHQ